MNLQQIHECERKEIDKLQGKLTLPNYFKKVGWLLFAFTLIFLLIVATFTEGNEIVKMLARNILLISLLIVAISREKIEDELVEKIRGQAFSLAFITGVLFALFQPYINYLVAAFVRPEKATFSQMGDFVIIWFMLVIYLCFFFLFKRTS